MVTKNLDYLTAAMQLSAMVLWKADRTSHGKDVPFTEWYLFQSLKRLS